MQKRLNGAKEGIPPFPKARTLAGVLLSQWELLEKAPVKKGEARCEPHVARLKKGELGAILACVADDAVWEKRGKKAIGRKLVSCLAPGDAIEVFVCLAEHGRAGRHAGYFAGGQVRPELFSKEQAVGLADAATRNDAVMEKFGWVLGKGNFGKMRYVVQRAVLFSLMAIGKLGRFEGVVDAEWKKFWRLSEGERKIAANAAGIFWEGGGREFFTRARLLLFEAQDRLAILAGAIREKGDGALGLARSFYCEESGRAALFQAIVRAREHSEGVPGSPSRYAWVMVGGAMAGLLSTLGMAIAVASGMYGGEWKKISEYGEQLLFACLAVGAGVGIAISSLLERLLTRLTVRRSERRAMREALVKMPGEREDGQEAHGG